jgi:hypothetical protein
VFSMSKSMPLRPYCSERSQYHSLLVPRTPSVPEPSVTDVWITGKKPIG